MIREFLEHRPKLSLLKWNAVFVPWLIILFSHVLCQIKTCLLKPYFFPFLFISTISHDLSGFIISYLFSCPLIPYLPPVIHVAFSFKSVHVLLCAAWMWTRGTLKSKGNSHCSDDERCSSQEKLPFSLLICNREHT